MRDIFANHGLNLEESLFSNLKVLLKAFLEENSKINLSAIRDENEVIKKHFIDSLLLTQFLSIKKQDKCLDLGSGSGFPAVCLSAFYKHEFICLDSVAKKLSAIDRMADKSNIRIKTIHGRIEDLAHNKTLRESFDIVTARALAPWPVLLEYSLPFLSIDGTFIAYQGPQIKEDLNKYHLLEEKFGGKLDRVEKLSYDGQVRYFIFIKKTKASKAKYPRSPKDLKEIKDQYKSHTNAKI